MKTHSSDCKGWNTAFKS